jgi:pSer/pThr/pTyr-binding forkhead associated (FHA) protein
MDAQNGLGALLAIRGCMAALSYDPSLPDSGVHRSAGPQGEQTAPRPARATLRVLSGPDEGRCFVLDADSYVLGRDGSADLQIAHSTVSRQHARVWREEDGRYFVEDLGSANGTAVGSRCVARSELRPRDRLQLGPHIQLRFELER